MRLLPDKPEMGWLPYGWLIYLTGFVAYPAMTGASAGRWAATAAGLAVFLVLYFWGHWREGPALLWNVGGIVLLAIVFSPTNPGASSFWIYAAAFLGDAGSRRFAFRGLLLLLAVLAVETWLVHLPFYVWLPSAVFSLLIGGVTIEQAEVRRANAKLHLAQEEIERLAKVAERERIARDLHDLLGHSLSLITLKAELAGRLLGRDGAPDRERAEREVREIERISRESLKEVRSAVTGYRAEDLPAELSRARLALESSSVACEYFATALDLLPAQESALAFALREAVTNVLRHSAARTCRVRIEQGADAVTLEVRDDGRGGLAPEGAGLTGMRERLAALGGRLERSGEHGTRLLVTLPVLPPGAAARRPRVLPAADGEKRVPPALASASRL
ncbi:MAG TPA: sensor histidine kinase [Thermoanaerobaculia bacterium]|nr:sensor histidine kinase [Thermoanaerobaculia bacterium]